MKYLLLILPFCFFTAQAQNLLNYNKRFVECEDRWVAYRMSKDSSYLFGFIYIDAQAGLTIDVKGSFKISADNQFIPWEPMKSSVKMRLEANNVHVALIPESKFEDLQITATPDWLKYYKTDTGSIERLYKWGFMYNAWDMSAKALSYLEQARKIDPKYKGLEFELAYAYNALEQYDKTVIIAKEAIKTDPDNCYLHKELSYAQIHLGQVDESIATYKKAQPVCSDHELRAEMAFNIAYQFFVKKDKERFDLWSAEVEKWANKEGMIYERIKKLEKSIGQ